MILVEFVAELRQFEVLRSNQILLLKNYIWKKYPDCSMYQRSIILVDAIHKVIDKNMQEFNKEIRDQVKYKILQRAVKTKNYDIDGSDIFRACLFLKDTRDSFKASLVNWLNKKCSNTVKERYIDLLLSKVADSYNEYADYELEYIISEVLCDLEDDCCFNAGVIDASQLGSFFAERVYAIYEDFKIKAVRWYIPHCILIACLFMSASIIENEFVLRQENIFNANNPPIAASETEDAFMQDKVLQYKKVDKERLLHYLSGRGSLLSEEPYFSSIIQASQEYNVNPLLLFAITGQEQAFVPKNQINAKLIANNPFNVYGSWQAYNTDTLDSARIAANLIATLSKNKPASIDPIVWINTQYAEDETWYIGVQKLLREIDEEVIKKASK